MPEFPKLVYSKVSKGVKFDLYSENAVKRILHPLYYASVPCYRYDIEKTFA